MKENSTNANAVKLLNMPIENGNHTEIKCSFAIEQIKNPYRIMIKDDTNSPIKNDFIILIENDNIKTSHVYTCPVLWAIDDMGGQYTIYNFSYKFIDKINRWYIDFWFDGILIGGHLEENLLKQKFDRIETIVSYEMPINIDSTHDSIHSVIEPIYIQDEAYEGLRQLLGHL